MADLDGLRVLVVEDEAITAMFEAMFLEEAGCEVVGPIGTIQEALAQVAEDHFDVALLDMNLHGQWSYPVIDALIAEQLPFVLVTAYEREHLLEPYRKCPCCSKPCPPDRLLDALSRVVAAQEPMPGSAGASGAAQA
jgi:CheY-like chemotaxis protein